MYTHTHTHTCAYILCICKFIVATIECGISHKDTKHTDKWSNNKTKTQKQNAKTTIFASHFLRVSQRQKNLFIISDKIPQHCVCVSQES